MRLTVCEMANQPSTVLDQFSVPCDDDKFTPTKHLTPPPHHSSSRPTAAHTATATPLLHQRKGLGPVDGPPQPI